MYNWATISRWTLGFSLNPIRGINLREKEQQVQKKTKERAMWRQRENEVMHHLGKDLFSELLERTNLDDILISEF